MADVLVVEDDDDVAFLTGAFLEQRGHRVRHARDGEKGLEALSEALPDVVLMDVEMPILSGPDMAARMIVDNCGRECIPVVILSGADELARIAERVGTPYFLTKPFDPAEMVALVERAVREGRFPTPPPIPLPAFASPSAARSRS